MSVKEGISSILNMIEGVQDGDGLTRAVSAIRDHYGLSHAMYYWVNTMGELAQAGTYPPEWLARYFSEGYERADPVVLACYSSFSAVDWQDLDWTGRIAQVIQQESVEYGLSPQGYTVPIRGPMGQYAVLTLNGEGEGSAWRNFCNENAADILLLTYALNEKALELDLTQKAPVRKPLSPRELDALTFLARGHSRAQVANLLSISEHTLRAYIESARKKLEASNTTNAVAKAIAQGFIIV